MAETRITDINLTDKQLSNSDSLKSDVIHGFTTRSDDSSIIVVSSRSLSEKEISDLKASFLSLPDEDSKETLEKKRLALIDQKKTELAIVALQVEGKLDGSGALTLAGNAIIEE